MRRNAIVAQSGGPSPVINASLAGVIEGCGDYPDRIGRLYAAWHGVEGLLREELIDLGAQPRDEIALLRTTPAAGAIGSCRYKLKEQQGEDFERLIRVMQAHDVGWFFYIGGNDSMDTAGKVSNLAREHGIDLVATGVPKTIDNDVGDPEFRLIDHTPGYGSCARYWAYLVQNLEEENCGMSPSEPVCVVQAMGRKSGWIPAAVRLGDPDRRMPIQIYFAESRHSLESLGENVRAAGFTQRPLHRRGERGLRRRQPRRGPRRLRPRRVRREPHDGGAGDHQLPERSRAWESPARRPARAPG